MNPTRETIAAALFAQLQTAGSTFKTYSRRPKVWDAATDMPALFVGQPEENYAYQHATASPVHVTLDFDVYVYINSGQDPNATPDTEMNAALDAIEASLAPPIYAPFKQTLGNLVDHAWIEGTIMRAPGYVDGKGMAFFTIKVLVPN